MLLFGHIHAFPLVALGGWAIAGIVLAVGFLLLVLWQWWVNAGDPFDELEAVLVVAIPEAVRELAVSRPVCCLRLFYYDTHAPPAGYGIDLKFMSAERRDELVCTHGVDAPYYIWSFGEGGCDGPFTNLRGHRKASRLFARIYRRMADDEEDEAVAGQLREVLHRVAKRLEERDWSDVCPVTDDFVVATADGSQVFADEFGELESSISEAKLELLRSRSYLGPDSIDWARTEKPEAG